MRESAWALLIEAQAATGDVAVATQTFHEFRRRLIDESGLTPSRELIELHRRLVNGEPTGDPHVPRTDGPVAFPPALSLESGDDDFVGREDILRRLRARYAQAGAGTRQFVLLYGEPGIGKTRLASEFAHEALADGAIVLYGRSDAETLVPYQPFVTAIGHYVTECGDGALARELGAELSEIGRLLPGLARRMPELREPLAVEPEMRRYRLFNAVANVLGFVARERPAVLILDSHWADPSTALLLQHTVAAPRREDARPRHPPGRGIVSLGASRRLPGTTAARARARLPARARHGGDRSLGDRPGAGARGERERRRRPAGGDRWQPTAARGDAEEPC